MQIVDLGTGPAIVLIPGVQGRWEWMQPAVDALAQRCRVITFSLADEPTCGGRYDEQAGVASYVDQVRDALDQCGLKAAAICGVSYGGLIAAAFAARHPERTASLVLVSAIPPSWTPDARVRFYLRAPRLLSPLFLVGSLRLYREIARANDGLFHGLLASARHAGNAIAHLFSPARMARRVKMLSSVDLVPELARVRCPVLIVTGEESLDRVVPVRLTREYSRLFPRATVATLARTGHLGLITRPDDFAAIVTNFIGARSGSEQGQNGVGSGSGSGSDPLQRRRVG